MAKKKKKQEEINTGEWLNTYADMVTLLLTFFVMLLASSTTNPETLQAISSYFNPTIVFVNSGQTINEGQLVGNGVSIMPEYQMALSEVQEISEEILESMEKTKEMVSDFKTYFQENNLSDKLEVSQEEDYLKINFKDNVLFDKSKATLKPEAIQILDMLSEQLLKYPDTDIEIEGHTDSDKINTPEFPNNFYLSSDRAVAVATYYIEQKKFPPERVVAIGYGEYRPIASNDTVEGKALNRRVEFKIRQRTSSEK